MFKTIEEFPNYEINEEGIVRNKKNLNILSINLNNKGYYQLNIGNKCRKLHRLLAQTFIANPNNLETVNHIDGDKVNNSLSNLEWMSRIDNVKHSREILNLIPIPYSKTEKEHHLINKKGKESNAGKQIIAILEDNSEKIFGSASEAARELFNDELLGKNIRQSIKRNSNTYKNIKFRDYESNNSSQK